MLTNFTWNIKQEMFEILCKIKQSAPCRRAIKLFYALGIKEQGHIDFCLVFHFVILL